MQKRVKCIDNAGYERSLTIGAEYPVVQLAPPLVEIVDDTGLAWSYPLHLFVWVDSSHHTEIN